MKADVNHNCTVEIVRSADEILQPLLIISDDDDDDDGDDLDPISTTSDIADHVLATGQFKVLDAVQSSSVTSAKKSRPAIRHSTAQKNAAASSRRRAVLSTPVHHSADEVNNCILSNLTFDTVPDILTVSRIGSIHYCLEDLYVKVFASLCTLAEFTQFVLDSPLIQLKQVTLSEKISIEQRMPALKQATFARYRLLPISASEYLLKLKQFLTDRRTNPQSVTMAEYMRHYKHMPSPTLSMSGSKASRKQLRISIGKRKVVAQRSISSELPSEGFTRQASAHVNRKR